MEKTIEDAIEYVTLCMESNNGIQKYMGIIMLKNIKHTLMKLDMLDKSIDYSAMEE